MEDYSNKPLKELEQLAEQPKDDPDSPELYDTKDLTIAWALYDKLLNGELTSVKELTESKNRELELLNALSDILYIINEDKDGSFFICEEGAETLNDARGLVGRIKALRGIV